MGRLDLRPLEGSEGNHLQHFLRRLKKKKHPTSDCFEINQPDVLENVSLFYRLIKYEIINDVTRDVGEHRATVTSVLAVLILAVIVTREVVQHRYDI